MDLFFGHQWSDLTGTYGPTCIWRIVERTGSHLIEQENGDALIKETVSRQER
jgi:hypothetical protein